MILFLGIVRKANLYFAKMVEAPGFFQIKITISLLSFKLDRILKLSFVD
jgi:hypothetical protein